MRVCCSLSLPEKHLICRVSLELLYSWYYCRATGSAVLLYYTTYSRPPYPLRAYVLIQCRDAPPPHASGSRSRRPLLLSSRSSRSSSRSTFTATEVEFDGLNSSSCRWWLWLGLQVECKAEHSEGNALHQRAHVGAIHTVASDGH